MKRIIIFLSILFFNASVFAQVSQETNENSNVFKIEDFILTQQLDSAAFYISKVKRSTYTDILNKISLNANISYLDYYKFIEKIGKRPIIDYKLVSNFINKTIKTPIDTKVIDLDFVKIRWLQISKLRDETTIEDATTEQLKLETYIQKFNQEDNNVIRANILSSTHQIVLYTIQKEVLKGKKLCLDNLEKANRLIDKELIILSLYHLCDFLILEGKLKEYIDACEESLAIENTLQVKSPYYIANLIHLLDAYIYQKGHTVRVQELLSVLYSNPETRADSYSLYAKCLEGLPLDSPLQKSIYKQFEVSNLIEFCKKIERLGEPVLNPNDYYHLLNESANALASNGFFNESLNYKDKCVRLIRKIYSEDLSISLANFKVKQVVKEKELELKHEKEKSSLYTIIIALIVVSLTVLIIVLVRIRKQSQALEIKNKQINNALREKELLVKEVHHRVKNNFQIILSLLDLQSKGIEDQKALKLVIEGKNRINSMALIHQKLYQNEEGLIDFEEYLKSLVKELAALYNLNNKVETNINSDNIFLDVDTAIPIGLIINELITNAYKYAFINNNFGKITINIEKVNKTNYKLTVSDNGIGLDPSFNIETTKTLGLRLVNRLVKQLQGSLNLICKDGLTFEILFKNLKARKSIS